MDLSHQIKKYRKQLAFSQEELAENYMFQDKRFQTGRMNVAILIFIIYYC